MPYDDEPIPFEEIARLQNLDEQIDQRLHGSAQALPNGQDALDPELLRDLRDYYQPRSQTFQSGLDRVWGRLGEQGVVPAQQQQSEPANRSEVRHERLRPMQYMFRTGQRWSSRASALVAAVLLAVLVGGLALGLILANYKGHSEVVREPKRTATPTTIASTTPTPSPTSGQTLNFTSIHMIDAMTGWSLSTQGVFRTTDGGNHWQDVTPPNLKGQINAVNSLAGSFLSATLAWVVISPGPSYVMRTTDGGQTWQSTEVQTFQVFQITFINPQDGWLISTPGVAAGSEAVTIYRSTDGGITWKQVQNTNFTTTPPPDALPVGGDKSGLTFLNASTGWATGTEPATNFAWLYVTHDGGTTWQQQTLPLPPGLTSVFFTIMPPRFFGAQTGILPVMVADANSDTFYLDAYVTHDGGATWQSTGLAPNGRIADFSDANHGWATNNTVLFATSNGGQTWTQLPASRAFNDVVSLDFVSSTTGWAISEPGNGFLLLKTTDGGRTWAIVTPSL